MNKKNRGSIRWLRVLLFFSIFYLGFGIGQSFFLPETNFLQLLFQNPILALANVVLWPYIFSTIGDFQGIEGYVIGGIISFGLIVLFAWISYFIEVRITYKREKEERAWAEEEAHRRLIITKKEIEEGESYD